MITQSLEACLRLPPQNLDAEVAVLGSMLLDSRVIPKVANILKREDFYSADHQVIYEAILDLYDKGKPADLLLLNDVLARRGELERIGGPDYLVSLVEKVSSAAQAEDYAGIVARHAHRRRLVKAAERVRERAMDPTATEEEIGKAVERVAAEGNRHLGAGKVHVVSLADIECQSIAWLWPNWLARGKLALLCGHGGVGKSLLVCDLAARITRGSRWPDGAEGAEPGRVLLLAGEDDPADMLRPRVEAAGGDPAMVDFVQAVSVGDKGQERLPDLTQDLPAIEDTIGRRGGVDLVVVDPLTCFLPGVDTNRDSEVRSLVLGPLAGLAQRHDCAVLCVLHLRKLATDVALHRIGGSVALGAAARLVWLLQRHPHATGRLCLALMKSNVGRSDLPVLSCRIEDRDGVPFLVWDRVPVEGLTAETLLAGQHQVHDSELMEAKRWLREMLGDGPVAVKEVRREAEAAGLAWRTIERAKAELRVVAERKGFGASGGGQWALPS